MAYSRQQNEEILRRLKQQEQMERYRNNQKRYTPGNAISSLKTANSFLGNSGKGLQNIGTAMSKSSNPILNNIGGKVGSVGSNFINLAKTPSTIKAGISGMFNGGAAAPSLASTAGTTSAIGGSTAAATGAGGTAAGASGALAAGSMAVPVAGWVAGAALAAKAIKDKFDEAQQKANRKAMEADAQAMQTSSDAALRSRQNAQQRMMEQSEADANAMAQPLDNQSNQASTLDSNSISDEIMNRIGQQQPDGVATGGAAPVQPQLPLVQVEDPNNNPNTSVPMYENNIMNAISDAKDMGINDSQLLNGIPQGLNNGNQDIAGLIDKYQIQKPQTDEEIALARKGDFNQPVTSQPVMSQDDTKRSILEKLSSGLKDFRAGYDDNSMNGFTDGDMYNQVINSQPAPQVQNGVLTGGAAQTKKSIMSRLGEAAGTGRRLMANPWVQAGIAGIISKADGGDIGDIAKAAYQYGTAKQKSDQYYKMMNPNAKVMPVFNTLDANDYKAKAYNDFNQGRTMITRKDFIKLNNPNWSDAQVDAYISGLGINGDEMLSLKGYDAVNKVQSKNRDLDIKQQKADNQNTYWNNKIGVDKQRVGVQQQNANTNAGRLAETKRSNIVKEKQNQQKIDNTKTNNDRNYNLKAQQNVQNAEKELQARGYKKVNGKWVKK